MYYALKATIISPGGHDHGGEHDHEPASHIPDAGDTYIIRTAVAMNLFTDELMWIWVWVVIISLLGVFVVIMITRFVSSMLDKQARRERESL